MFYRRPYARMNRGRVRHAADVAASPSGPAALEFVTRVVLTSDASWDPGDAASGEDGSFIVWGGGGGANSTTGSGTRNTGGGAECVTKTYSPFAPPYNIQIGAGGIGATDGAATAGGNSTINSTEAIATGGGPGSDGVAGTGGSGGTGDTTRAGGNGLTGTSNNTSGGASAGSSTAASGTTPGAPNGHVGGFLTGVQGLPGTGAGTSAGNPGNGGQGMAIARYLRVADLNYPYVDADGVRGDRDASNLTDRTIVWGGTHEDGDLLVCISAVDGGGNTALAGSTQLSIAGFVSIHVIDSSATPPTSLTSASERVNWRTFRVKNSAGAAACEATAAAISSTNTDPPTLTYSGSPSTVAALWIEAFAIDAALGQLEFEQWSSGFEQTIWVPPESTAGVGLAIGIRRETAASVNPGATVHNNNLGGVCVALIPVAGS